MFTAGAMGSAALAAGVAAAATSEASWARVGLFAAVPFGAALVLDLASRLAGFDLLLSLSPEERLRWNDRMARTVLELRDAFAASLPDDAARPPGRERR